MRWFPYFILAYVTLGLQIGLAAHIAVGGAPPNLVLLAAIFIAIHAPRDAALLGCFGLGLIQDMTTQNTLGLFSFSYSFVAMFVVSTQQVVYKSHPLTHFSLALVGMFLTGVVLLLHAWIRGPEAAAPMTFFYSSLYTAILAPVVLGVLDRAKRAFAFQSPRRKLRL